MTTTPSLTAICQWYHIPLEFAHAVMKTFVGADYDTSINDIHKLLDRYDSFRIQLEYAFSTAVRGKNLVAQLRRWGVPVDQVGAKTYLDIGCAYAGFLTAFQACGFAVTGIEFDEQFGKLGELNLRASGCPPNILIGDFLSASFEPEKEAFDLITCNDVIEHVMDPELCLRKICNLLKPGGVAYIASPNKLSIPNVRADVHFQRFGLTLLDYYRARAAYTMYSGYPTYSVSDFYEPEWYLNVALSAGMKAEIVYDEESGRSDAAAEIASLYAAFSNWTKADAGKLDPLMRHEVVREFGAYSARMFQAYHDHVSDHSLEAFSRTWIDPLTRILVRKSAS